MTNSIFSPKSFLYRILQLCGPLFLMPGLIAGQSKKLMPYSNIIVQGELGQRAERNFYRLGTDMYKPENIFINPRKTMDSEWPGDFEGRLLLGLVLEGQALHTEHKNLTQMLDSLPKYLNPHGYFGRVQNSIIVEQQLSGNGWYLRALCELYVWKKDPKIKNYISRVINNLALPTIGYHSQYPLEQSARKKNSGEASGTTQGIVGKWALSTDVGCDFIFMDGVIQAYKILPSIKLKKLIDEMIQRFLQMDLLALNAQTHATLTGIRALIRYYEITNQPYLLHEAIKRYGIYRSNAMTANYENFNWFGRPDWTEPCAIVDSFMAAIQLWQHTNQTSYLEDGHRIYYNAICNTQRANGGFGLSNCPYPKNNILKINTDEAWWCCTMRGAEGLASAIRYNYFITKNKVVIPFFNNSIAKLHLESDSVNIKQESGYPFIGKVDLKIIQSSTRKKIDIEFFLPRESFNINMQVNGKSTPFTIHNGFISIQSKMIVGTHIKLDFDLNTSLQHVVNRAYSKPDFYTISYGQLLLGLDVKSQSEITFPVKPIIKREAPNLWKVNGTSIYLTPVYHLLDRDVNKKSQYAKQIIFKVGPDKIKM
jgi:hypothetical protein